MHAMFCNFFTLFNIFLGYEYALLCDKPAAFHKSENKIKTFPFRKQLYFSLSTRAKLKTRLVRMLMYLAIVFKVA